MSATCGYVTTDNGVRLPVIPTNFPNMATWPPFWKSLNLLPVLSGTKVVIRKMKSHFGGKYHSVSYSCSSSRMYIRGVLNSLENFIIDETKLAVSQLLCPPKQAVLSLSQCHTGYHDWYGTISIVTGTLLFLCTLAHHTRVGVDIVSDCE